MSRRQSRWKQPSQKTDFATIFFKCRATSLATSWAGLEGASGLRSDRPCMRRVGKGNEFNSAANGEFKARPQQQMKNKASVCLSK